MLHRFRRVLSVALAAALALTALALPRPAPAAAATFSDIGSSPFAVDIEWLAAEGISNGCGGGRFCPRNPVTRAQMASFLVRMFDYPPTEVDYFNDDSGSTHQADINAVAAAGITNGCGSVRYCPDDAVSREEMASFLTRAAALPAATADYFLDDERSAHQAAINGLALAGVTGGCGNSLFCPRQDVSREQMAAFLHRLATGGGSPPPALYGMPPTCAYRDVLTARRSYTDWATSLLDTTYMLPSTYAPGDLVTTSTAGLNGGHLVRRHLAADLTAMASAARSAGAPIAVQSAYRSYATQQATFDYWVSVGGYEQALLTSARAGHSEHQLGTALDFRSDGGPAPWDLADWATTPAGRWMATNAWQYGFVMSYPQGQQGVTCYAYEPWHYRYVGRATAAVIRAAAIAPRVYLWRLYGS